MEFNTRCPRCGMQVNNDSNRLVTDSCGHLKCRNCLLADENGCSECRLASFVAVESVEVIVPPTTNSELNKTENLVSNPIDCIDKTNGYHQYHCKQCGKYFRSRSQKYYHAGCGNDGAKRFKCNHNDCTKRFATKSHLSYHMESHNPGKYQCTYCDKVFKHPTVLKKHKRCHQQELVTCDQCQKQFRGSMALTTHMAMHSGKELPFACTHCNRCYLTKSALLQHMQKHADKQHKCPICHKMYQRNSILQLHMKRHSKLECHSCATCHKVFTDNDALMRHKKKHSSTIDKFRCIHCDIMSIRKDNMLRHVRNMHTGLDFESCVETIVATAIVDKSNDEAPMPQTVENSSVIKCIGNVKPVYVPTSFAKEASATERELATPIGEEPRTYTTLENVKQIKKSKYDPFKHYLKILNTASETENSVQDTEEAENETETETQTLNEITQRPPTEQQQIQQERANLGQPNFMHWRKKFKYA